MSARDCSQESLNFSMLELQVSQRERSELDESLDISAQLASSMHDEGMETDKPPMITSHETPILPGENQQGSSNTENRHRIPVKQRLGKKPVKTQAQSRLSNRASTTSGIERIPFKFNRINYASNSLHLQSRNSNKNVLSGAKRVNNFEKANNWKQNTQPLTLQPLASSTTKAYIAQGGPGYPMPVPPPCLTIPPPTAKKQLTEYIIKNLAGELVASAASKYDIHLYMTDIENALRTARRN